MRVGRFMDDPRSMQCTAPILIWAVTRLRAVLVVPRLLVCVVVNFRQGVGATGCCSGHVGDRVSEEVDIGAVRGGIPLDDSVVQRRR